MSFAAPPHTETYTLRAGPVRVSGTAHGPFSTTARAVRNPLPAASVTFRAGPNGSPGGAHFGSISWLHKAPVIPAIATAAFLAATRQRVGSVISLPVGNVPLRMRIVASVAAFPTVPAAGGGVVVDDEMLQRALLITGTPPLPVTQWWLRAAGGLDFRGITPGLRVTSRTAVAAAMTGNPFAADVRQALAAIAAAAVILALAGFAVSMAAGRERRPELALLDALGMPRRQLLRMLRTEQLLLSVPSAAAGVILGAVLAQLIVPALTLTPAGGAPVLPVIVTVPWLLAAALAAVIAAFPVLIAPLAGRASDTVAVLRQGAQE